LHSRLTTARLWGFSASEPDRRNRKILLAGKDVSSDDLLSRVRGGEGRFIGEKTKLKQRCGGLALQDKNMTEIKLRKGEDVNRALRRLKKTLGREKLFEELRKRRHYEKPSKALRLKSKKARFNEMLRQRYSDL
jgi:small subunit ribosomal protein S21